ncbi:unnamed protein product [Trichobilharzia regenti]|nr:unnamed protein product [Trichobilharzia regenti]
MYSHPKRVNQMQLTRLSFRAYHLIFIKYSCIFCHFNSMDRLVRKINTSPRSKRKTFVQTADNFGVPLKVLLERDCIKPVPRIVKNICEYLLTNGLNAQGIFRINGSAKLIEALKSTFQISAADDLYSIGNVDIYALAGVLKLFLRELPDGLVNITDSDLSAYLETFLEISPLNKQSLIAFKVVSVRFQLKSVDL